MSNVIDSKKTLNFTLFECEKLFDVYSRYIYKVNENELGVSVTEEEGGVYLKNRLFLVCDLVTVTVDSGDTNDTVNSRISFCVRNLHSPR